MFEETATATTTIASCNFANEYKQRKFEIEIKINHPSSIFAFIELFTCVNARIAKYFGKHTSMKNKHVLPSIFFATLVHIVLKKNIIIFLYPPP